MLFVNLQSISTACTAYMEVTYQDVGSLEGRAIHVVDSILFEDLRESVDQAMFV